MTSTVGLYHNCNSNRKVAVVDIFRGWGTTGFPNTKAFELYLYACRSRCATHFMLLSE